MDNVKFAIGDYIASKKHGPRMSGKITGIGTEKYQWTPWSYNNPLSKGRWSSLDRTNDTHEQVDRLFRLMTKLEKILYFKGLS